jgi:hypothetical protein
MIARIHFDAFGEVLDRLLMLASSESRITFGLLNFNASVPKH